MKAASLAILALFVISALAFTPSVESPARMILWQNPNHVLPCNSTYSGDALRYLGDQTFTIKGAGCSQDWLVVVPPTEHENLSAEVSWFQAHHSAFEGVIIDDALYISPADLRSLYASLKALTPNVCPQVSFPVLSLDPAVFSGCVVMGAFTTTLNPTFANFTQAQWESAINNALKSAQTAQTFTFGRVMLLAFADTPSGAQPTTAAYLQAVHSVAQAKGITEVVWY